MPVLRVKSGSNKGAVFDLTAESISMGRDCPDGVQILDQGVSRRHAEVFRIGEMFFVRDLQSRNGVFLNDEKIVEELLQPGDQIRIGQTIFVFEHDAEQARAVAKAEIERPREVIEFDDDDHETSYSKTLMLDLDLGAGGYVGGGGGGGASHVPAESLEFRYLSTIYALGKTISSEKSLTGLFNDFLKVAGTAVQSDSGYIFVNAGKNNFLPRASWHKDDAEGAGGNGKKRVSQAVSTSIVKRTIDFGKPIMTTDATEDSRFAQQHSIVLKHVRSVICAPLKVRDKVHGVVYLNMVRTGKSFSAEDLELISALALQAGLAMDSIQSAQKQRENLFNIVRAMVGLIEERDPESRGKSLRVMNTAAAIGQTLKLKPQQRYTIELAALLHDVGSLAVAGAEFMEPVQKYEAIVAAGERFVKSMKTMDAILQGIRYQFARFDGSGWPSDANAANTPTIGKIITVARDFEELQSTPDPETNEPVPVKSILVKMSKQAGSRYDPQAIQALLLAAKHGTLFNPQPIFKDLFAESGGAAEQRVETADTGDE
ncbi:MAG: HD domain-containing phosphohydrolase [Planctomycetota bacterium]